MNASVQAFAAILRSRGMRISVPDVLDAIRCAMQPGMLSDRETLRCALKAALLKQQRDAPEFDEVFDAFFGLDDVRRDPARPESVALTEQTADSDAATDASAPAHAPFVLSDDASASPLAEGPAPEDVHNFFDTDDLASRHNLTEDEGMIDLSSPSDEMAFSQNNQATGEAGFRIQLDTDRLHTSGAAGQLSAAQGTSVSTGLSAEETDALLDWLGPQQDSSGGEAADIRGDFSAALKRHAEALLALQRPREDWRRSAVEHIDEQQQRELDQTLRRLAQTIRGAPTHRRTVSRRGCIHAARTMRRSMRFGGVPFTPVTVSRRDDRAHLVVLADISLSVRATTRFTLNVLHGLSDLFRQVRSFVFVADVTETTELFAEYRDDALGFIIGGDAIDLDANSDYGMVFRTMLSEHSSAINRKTTLLVLGDGRSNGNDPGVAEFEELARRARETIWLSPEPRYSWRLGHSAMPQYEDLCDRVRIVRNLQQLEHVALDLAGKEGR
ncbi:VWA domain-containing protein [Hoyosella altamirensis]|uniref:VWA domain-containing protein n=1 Tax=Hoyosella altamirensis TaxID=616997 RepID=A0A839RR92_9ACTN|nr:VWA domain-containing protein [Hoyosella altamirensis]MBB3038391.1 hypothetical protein [Hoyosella altamirensis]